MNKHNSSTSSSREIVIFIIKMCFLFIFVLAFFYHAMPQYIGGYNSSMIDKAERIDSLSGPKIVLIGHSGLSFGIDSAKIEEAFQMPVVNMGLHGGLGNAFHEEMTRMNVVDGDIYVVSHSAFNDSDAIGNPVLAWTTIENNPRLWRLLRKKDMIPMARAYPTYLRRILDLYSAGTGNKDGGGVYSRSAFNEYGDISLDRLGHSWKFEQVDVPEIGDVTITRLNELNQWLEERGATLLIASYNIGNGHHTAPVDDYISFQEELKNRLDCPVISNYVDYMFPYMYFYDTTLHLTNEGTRVRTEQLISDLQRWMDTGDDAEVTMPDYDDVLYDCRIPQISDFKEYMLAIEEKKDTYAVFVSAKDEAVSGLDENDFRLLDSIGVTKLTPDSVRSSYYGVCVGGKSDESVSNDFLETEGTIDLISYSIKSAGFDCGDTSSIVINRHEYSYNQRGLNIVVYNRETGRIVDCVSFDTYLPEKPAFRQ